MISRAAATAVSIAGLLVLAGCGVKSPGIGDIDGQGDPDVVSDVLADGTDTGTVPDAGDDTWADPDVVDDPGLDGLPDVVTDTGVDPDAALDPDPDPDPEVPECVVDADCGSADLRCLVGICRDRCTWLINPCDWAPSGDICHGGYCVECENDSHCPGTRYTCDTTRFVCVDRPFDPDITRIGVFYHTWHCPSAADVHDLSRTLAGTEPWPPWPSTPFPPVSFWWDEPAAGYYCLTDNVTLLTQHAEMLRDMGADFVFVDVTNHPYNTGTLCDRPEQMIIQPFTTLVNVWSGIAGAPRIVPWVPITAATSSDTSRYMVTTLLSLLNAHPGLQFVYEGKPLILVTENTQWPVDEATVASLSATYTIRRMWAYEADGTAKWSYLEDCEASPLDSQPCFQRMAVSGGSAEQLPISLAYQADYMSHTATATPKHHGKTFRKQFETLFDNPEIPIATITGFNEWVVGRLPCDLVPLCPCSDPQNANGCFLDQYDAEYNRDIEPANNPDGTFYYDLVTSCIDLFRAGERCTDDNAAEPCCHD